MENLIFWAVLFMEESQPLRFCKIVPTKKKVAEKKYGPETGPNKIQPSLLRNFKIIFQKITSWRQFAERLAPGMSYLT